MWTLKNDRRDSHKSRAFRPTTDAMESREALSGLGAALAHSAPPVFSTFAARAPATGGGIGAFTDSATFARPVATNPTGINFSLANGGRNPGSTVFPTSPGTSTAPVITVSPTGGSSTSTGTTTTTTTPTTTGTTTTPTTTATTTTPTTVATTNSTSAANAGTVTGMTGTTTTTGLPTVGATTVGSTTGLLF